MSSQRDFERMASIASMIAYYWREKLAIDPPEPKAWAINLGSLLRTLFGLYCVSYALVPFGVRYVPGFRREKGGFFVWTCGQAYVFGVRVARWVSGEARWVPDERKPRPQLARLRLRRLSRRGSR